MDTWTQIIDRFLFSFLRFIIEERKKIIRVVVRIQSTTVKNSVLYLELAERVL